MMMTMVMMPMVMKIEPRMIMGPSHRHTCHHYQHQHHNSFRPRPSLACRFGCQPPKIQNQFFRLQKMLLGPRASEAPKSIFRALKNVFWSPGPWRSSICYCGPDRARNDDDADYQDDDAEHDDEKKDDKEDEKCVCAGIDVQLLFLLTHRRHPCVETQVFEASVSKTWPGQPRLDVGRVVWYQSCHRRRRHLSGRRVGAQTA